MLVSLIERILNWFYAVQKARKKGKTYEIIQLLYSFYYGAIDIVQKMGSLDHL